MKKLLFVISISMSLSSSYGQTLYPDIVFGGKKIGEMIVYKKEEEYYVDNILKFGDCKSNKLNDFGIVKFDMDNGVLEIKPFPKCLEKEEISYHKKQKQKFINTRSFYVNYMFNMDNSDNRDIALQSGLFIFDTFFYSDALLNKEKTVRNQTYIQKDIPDKLIRVRFGDTYTRTYMLSNVYQLFGFSIGKEPTLNPNERLFRTFDYTVTLEDYSIVEVYSNNILIDRKELPSGIYSFRDLPVSAVNNTITVKIIDKTTLQEKVLTIPFVFSGNLLKKGSLDYNFSAGIKRQSVNTYQKIGYAGYIRYGLTDLLTPGVSFSEKEQAIHLDSTFLEGILTAGISNKEKYLLSYTYSKQDWGLSVSKTDKDIKLSLAKRFTDLGTITFFLHNNSKNFYSITWNNRFFGGTIDFTMAKLEKDTQFRLGYTKSFGKQPSVVAMSTLSDRDKRQYNARYSHIFRDYEDKSFGYDISYTNTETKYYSSNQYNATLSVKYINLYRLNAYKIDNTRENINFSISGSFACVENICRIGEPVTSGAFAVGNYLSANGRKAIGVLNIFPYLNQDVVDDRDDISQSRMEVTPKWGQGVTLLNKRIYKVFVYYNGFPLILTDLKINGEETFTGKSGEVIFESDRDTIEIELFGRKYIKRIDNEKIYIGE